ncbi:MAG TPA: hypothetical protein VFV38_09940 [Ktedonobacteraceae bacterium]|nr:hypothetical protein [Ktedonobacteraceae bacterium]
MEERSNSGNETEKDNNARSWEETKKRAQSDFSVEAGSTIAIDRIRAQVLLNAKFWENEILHEHLGDVTKNEREKQPDLEEPER